MCDNRLLELAASTIATETEDLSARSAYGLPGTLTSWAPFPFGGSNIEKNLVFITVLYRDPSARNSSLDVCVHYQLLPYLVGQSISAWLPTLLPGSDYLITP